MAPQTLTKKEFCTVLGITYPTTKRDAKVAFMKFMREHHEDKGGVKEKNQLINEVWEVLSGKTTGDDNNTDSVSSDGSDGDDEIDSMENDSDSNYKEDEETDAEGDSTSLSGFKVEDGADDAGECAFDVDYGHLKDTGGHFAVEISVTDHDDFCGCDLDSPDTPHFLTASESGFEVVEVTVEEHASFCSCDLNDKDSKHFLLHGGYDSDHDSTLGDMESDEEAEEDAAKK